MLPSKAGGQATDAVKSGQGTRRRSPGMRMANSTLIGTKKTMDDAKFEGTTAAKVLSVRLDDGGAYRPPACEGGLGGQNPGGCRNSSPSENLIPRGARRDAARAPGPFAWLVRIPTSRRRRRTRPSGGR